MLSAASAGSGCKSANESRLVLVQAERANAAMPVAHNKLARSANTVRRVRLKSAIPSSPIGRPVFIIRTKPVDDRLSVLPLPIYPIADGLFSHPDRREPIIGD